MVHYSKSIFFNGLFILFELFRKKILCSLNVFLLNQINGQTPVQFTFISKMYCKRRQKFNERTEISHARKKNEKSMSEI